LFSSTKQTIPTALLARDHHDVGHDHLARPDADLTAHVLAVAVARTVIEPIDEAEAQSVVGCLPPEEFHTGRSRRELKLESRCCLVSASPPNKTAVSMLETLVMMSNGTILRTL